MLAQSVGSAALADTIIKSWDEWTVKRKENFLDPCLQVKAHSVSIYFGKKIIHEFKNLINHTTEIFFFSKSDGDACIDSSDNRYIALHTFGANTGTVAIYKLCDNPTPSVTLLDSAAYGTWTKVQGSNIFVLETQDDSFMDLADCHANSARPRIILRFTGGKFIPDAALMRKPTPTEQEFQYKLNAYKTVRNSSLHATSKHYPRALLDPILDFLYSGRAQSADAFIKKALEGHPSYEKDLRDALNQTLNGNPRWQKLVEQGFGTVLSIKKDYGSCVDSD